MQRLPPLAAIRVFEAAARHENFSRAAEELAMTQAGVSYQIKLLEERLGAQLFARAGRSIALTPLGHRIAPMVSNAFAGLAEAFTLARAEDEAVLSITAPVTFATQWLAPRLGSFQLLRPEIAVRLDVANAVVDLATGVFDIAIRGTRDPAEGMISVFLMRQFFAPMASPDFLARFPVATIEDLANVPLISPADGWWALWFDAIGAPQPFAPHSGALFDSQVLDGQAALAGQGVAMLNPAMFPQALADGRLRQVFPQLATDPRCFRLTYAPHKRNSAKIRAFRDWMIAEIRGGLGDDPLGVMVAPDDC